MQSIITKYSVSASGQGSISIQSQYGRRRILWDDALNSTDNHRRAADHMCKVINDLRGTSFSVVSCAPSPGKSGGWVFLINQVPEIAPCWQSITVRFMPGTNTRSAYMKAHSWLIPAGVKVDYSRETKPGDVQGAAFYAAAVMLDMINDIVRDVGIKYELKDYIHTYTGDRVFSLR